MTGGHARPREAELEERPNSQSANRPTSYRRRRGTEDVAASLGRCGRLLESVGWIFTVKIFVGQSDV